MTSEKIIFTIDDLYRTLKKHDTDILKHFCDSKLSDNEYFAYAIQSDIMSNALVILINMFMNNLESAGVDNCCRTLIESFVILKMDALGDISDEQKSIFRYLYAYVDYDNNKSLLDDEVKKSKWYKIAQADKDRAKEKVLNYFKCTDKELKQHYAAIDDPCFYLKKNLNDDVRFSTLLEKYPIAVDSYLKMYELFSLFIHPNCELDKKAYKSIMELRKKHIDILINYVVEYLKACKLIIKDESLATFKQDFYENPILINNVNNIREVDKAFQYLDDNFCSLKNGYDYFTWHFLTRTKALVIDMMISLSLGYKEHVISLFKPFIENMSVFYVIGSCDNLNSFNCIKRGYWCSSRMQIELHLKNIAPIESSIPEDVIKELYDAFYKEKYNLSSCDQFKEEMARNSLYPINPSKKNYSKIVKEYIDNVFKKEESISVKHLYKVAKDISHASGYSFNANEGMIDVSCQKVMIVTWKSLINFVAYAHMTLLEHDEKSKIEFIIQLFKQLLDMNNDGLKQVFESYDDGNN